MIRSVRAKLGRAARRGSAQMIRIGSLRVICAVRVFGAGSRPARRSAWQPPKR